MYDYENTGIFFPAASYFGVDYLHGKISDIENQRNPPFMVKLFDQTRNGFITSFYTRKNGEYSIEHIDMKKGPFFIISHDDTQKYNGVIADNIGGPNYVDN